MFPNKRCRMMLAIVLVNATILALAVCLAVARIQGNLVATVFDGSIVVTGALALGQIHVVVLMFAMLEPRSSRRWVSVVLVSAVASTVGIAIFQSMTVYPDPITYWPFIIIIPLAALIGICLVARVVWWPIHQVSRCWMAFEGCPAAKAASGYSLRELLLWTAAAAGLCGLMVSYWRVPFFSNIVLTVLLPTAVTMPIAAAAMAAGLRRTSLHWVLLI